MTFLIRVTVKIKLLILYICKNPVDTRFNSFNQRPNVSKIFGRFFIVEIIDNNHGHWFATFA